MILGVDSVWNLFSGEMESRTILGRTLFLGGSSE